MTYPERTWIMAIFKSAIPINYIIKMYKAYTPSASRCSTYTLFLYNVM